MAIVNTILFRLVFTLWHQLQIFLKKSSLCDNPSEKGLGGIMLHHVKTICERWFRCRSWVHNPLLTKVAIFEKFTETICRFKGGLSRGYLTEESLTNGQGKGDDPAVQDKMFCNIPLVIYTENYMSPSSKIILIFFVNSQVQ